MSQYRDSRSGHDGVSYSCELPMHTYSEQLKDSEIKHLQILFTCTPSIFKQVCTELLGTVYIKKNAAVAHLDLGFDSDEKALPTIACTSLKALFSHRKSYKQMEVAKSFSSIVSNLFTDGAVAVCAITCDANHEATSCYHAIMFPFEDTSVLLHIIPEISEIDLERIISTKGDCTSSSPFSMTGGISPSMRLFGSRDNSPSEFSGVFRPSPSFHRQQSLPNKNIGILQPRPMVNPLLNNDRYANKRRNLPTPPTADGPPGSSMGSTRKVIKRIGSLNSLFSSKINVSNRSHSQNDIVSARGLPSSVPLVTVTSLTPDDQMMFSSRLTSGHTDPAATTSSTVIYTPPDEAAFNRLQQEQGTSPTVRYSMSTGSQRVVRSRSLDSLASPSPTNSNAIAKSMLLDTATPPPIQMDQGSLLFYSPESFTHDYAVGDGDGSRSLMADLKDCPQLDKRTSVVGPDSNKVNISNQSLFSMIMGEEFPAKGSAKDKAAVKNVAGDAIKASVRKSNYSDNILAQMDSELAKLEEMPMEIATTVERECQDEDVADSIDRVLGEEEIRVSLLKQKVLDDKIFQKKRYKKLGSSVSDQLYKCVILRAATPADTAKAICSLISKTCVKLAAEAKPDDMRLAAVSPVKDLIIGHYELFEMIAQPSFILTDGSAALKDTELTTLFVLSAFFLVESVILARSRSKIGSSTFISKGQYKYIVKKATVSLYMCIDHLGIIFKPRVHMAFYEKCNLEWLFRSDAHNADESVEAEIRCNMARKLSLFDKTDTPINIISAVCDTLRLRYPKCDSALVEAMVVYDDDVESPPAPSPAKPEVPTVPAVISLQRGLSATLMPSVDENISDWSEPIIGLNMASAPCVSINSRSLSSGGKKSVNSLLGDRRASAVNGNRTGIENRLRKVVSSGSASKTLERNGGGATISATGMISRGSLMTKSSSAGRPSRPPVPIPVRVARAHSSNGNIGTSDILRNDSGKRSRSEYNSNFAESTPISKLKKHR